jgi:hypothetical protein
VGLGAEVGAIDVKSSKKAKIEKPAKTAKVSKPATAVPEAVAEAPVVQRKSSRKRAADLFDSVEETAPAPAVTPKTKAMKEKKAKTNGKEEAVIESETKPVTKGAKNAKKDTVVEPNITTATKTEKTVKKTTVAEPKPPQRQKLKRNPPKRQHPPNQRLSRRPKLRKHSQKHWTTLKDSNQATRLRKLILLNYWLVLNHRTSLDQKPVIRE